LTVHWARHVLASHAPKAHVSEVNLESVDVGTTTRFRVTVEHDAKDALPKRWFIKAPSAALKARFITAMPRLLHKEVCFYRYVASSTPVNVPTILAAQSQWGRGATLVLADLGEQGAAPGHPSDTLTPAQAEGVVRQLARLHARFWNKTELMQTHRWLKGSEGGVENLLGTLLAVPLMRQGLSLAGDAVPVKLHARLLDYARRRRAWMRHLASGAVTLVHHDCHPGNLFWMGDQPGFLDWQLIRVGEGIGDIAYFLATALEPDCRRAHEKRLLHLYSTCLAEHGVEALDDRQLLQRYRAHLAYPLEAMVVTLAIGGMLERNANLSLIRRALAAAWDHDAFAAREWPAPTVDLARTVLRKTGP
jgi:aminoglycoside/choline kinase family phosphotransferase